MPPPSTTLSSLHNQVFDYIIVGGGTSGCLIASRLASAAPRTNILLVEGGVDEDPDNLIPGLTKCKYGSPDGNWSYETTPQQGLKGRRLAYPRGKGLGGCSANNWLAWIRGPKCDYDDWAEVVEDKWWRWENVVEVMKRLEDFRPECPKGEEKYAHPSPNAHSYGGPIAVGYGKAWQQLIAPCLLASQEAGHVINPDVNDGDPIGLSIPQMNVGDGVRTTSATAFLSAETRARLPYLTILTRTICSKVLFTGITATGVHLLPTTPALQSDHPTIVHASSEIILAAGVFASPQILLLSGIGCPAALSTLSIPLTHPLPAVGHNLRDHAAVALEFLISPSIRGHNQLLNSPTALRAAHEEYTASRTGPLAVFGASAAVLFPHLAAVHNSVEFRALPADTQRFLKAEGRPSTEIWMMGGPAYYEGMDCPPDASVLTLEGLCQNMLSRGTVRLASADPRELPVVDPGYLAEPYDVRVAVETLREMVRLANTPTMKGIREGVLHGPLGVDGVGLVEEGDEEGLRAWVRGTLNQGFHAMGTCVMGRDGESNRVVGKDFRVVGVKGLRVADLSVCPVLTSNHTQINAYLIGERCAQLILEEREKRGE